MNPNGVRVTLLVATLGVAIGVPREAGAEVRTISAGAACQSANGGANAMFVRSAHYLAHVGSTDQYVVCLIPWTSPARQA